MRRLATPSRGLVLQGMFYAVATVFYVERQWNFDFYYAPALVQEFASPLLGFLVAPAVYPLTASLAYGLHGVFLAVLLLAAFNRKSTAGNIFLFSFNTFMLYLNYAPGYGADIFIQTGLFFFMLFHPKDEAVLDGPALRSMVLLRSYLGLNYILSAVHKLIDLQRPGPNFLSILSDFQERNDVWGPFLVGKLGPQLDLALAVAIIGFQALGGGGLFFRRTYRYALALLITFHVASIVLLNLVVFPVVAIVLLLLATREESYLPTEKETT